MTQDAHATADTQAAEIAQLGAITGPVIPYVIYRLRRERDPFGAREAARATNFGVLVLAAFAVATLVRALVPFVGFLGTLAQLAVVASSWCSASRPSARCVGANQHPIPSKSKW